MTRMIYKLTDYYSISFEYGLFVFRGNGEPMSIGPRNPESIDEIVDWIDSLSPRPIDREFAAMRINQVLSKKVA